MASSSSFVLPHANRFPSFHRPLFTYLPSIILLFRGSNYFEYFISIMIMIIFIIIIHAGSAKGQVVAENILPPTSASYSRSEWGCLLSSSGVASLQEWTPFSATHFLGVWTYCGVSVMSSTKSPIPAPQQRKTSRICGWTRERGLIIKRPPFCGAVITRVGFDLLLVGAMNRGRDEDCFTIFGQCGGWKKLFS